MASGGLAKLKLEMEIVGDKIVVTGLDNVTSSVDRAAASTKTATQRMAADMDNTASASGRMAASFGVIATAAAAAFATAGTLSIGYLAQIETASLGIAAAFITGGKYIDNTTGKALEGQSALKAAQADTVQVMEQLKVANMQTIATLDQLVRAYQETLPVAMAKGFDREQVLQFTQGMVQAAGAIGLSMDQLGEETRSLLTGNINPRNSRIATVLGLRNEDLEAYKGNASALFDFLMQKLDAYTIAGVEAQTTWAGVTSNLKDIAGQAGGMAFQGLFDVVKSELTEITKSIVTIDEKTKTITWNPDFLTFIEDMKQGIISVIAEIYRMNGLLDKAGGTKTSLDMLVAGPGSALGISRDKHPFLAMLFGSKEEFEDAAKKNIEYADRYLENDKKLQELGYRAAGLDANGNPLKSPAGNSTYQPPPPGPDKDAEKAAAAAAKQAETQYNAYSNAMDSLNQRIREHNPLIDKQANELAKVDDEINRLIKATPQYETSLRAAGSALKQNITFEYEYKEILAQNKQELADYAAAEEATRKMERDNIKQAIEDAKTLATAIAEAKTMAYENDLTAAGQNSDPYVAEMNQMEVRYQREFDLIKERKSLLETSLAAEMEGSAKHKATVTQIAELDRKTHLAEKQQIIEAKKLTEDANRSKLAVTETYAGGAATLFSTLAAAQDNTSRSGFETAKYFNLGAATMSTAAGIMNQYSSGDPYTANFRAAIVAGVGAIQIATIAGTSFGGGGGSVSAPSGSFGGGGSAGGGSGLGNLVAPVISVQDSQLQDSTAMLIEAQDRNSIVIGRLSKSIDDLTDMFKEGGSARGLAVNAPGRFTATSESGGVFSSAYGDMKQNTMTGVNGARGFADILLTGGLTNLQAFSTKVIAGSLGIGSKWQTSSGGLSIGYGDGGYGVQDYTKQKKDGGWFGSDKERFRYTDDAAATDFLNAAMTPFVNDLATMADTFKLAFNPAEYTAAAVRIQTSGKTADEIGTALSDLMQKTLQGMTLTMDGLEDVIGSYDDAYQRLKDINDAWVTANEQLQLIGDNALEQNIKVGASMEASINGIWGGLDGFKETMEAYRAVMYTDAERDAQDALAAQRTLNTQWMGTLQATYGEMPQTISAFNTLRDSIDPTSPLYKAVTDIGIVFGELANSAREVLEGRVADAMTALEASVTIEKNAAEEKYNLQLERIAAEEEAARSASQAEKSALQSELQTKQALYKDQETALKASFNAQQEVFKAQESAARDYVSKLSQVAGTLKSAYDSLADPAGDTLMSRQAAQAQIRAYVKSGGLPMNGELDSALKTVTTSGAGLFTNSVDYRRDAALTAVDLRTLSDRASGRLSAAEATLQALQDRNAAARAEHETSLAELKIANEASQAYYNAQVSFIQLQTDTFTAQRLAAKSALDAETSRLDQVLVKAQSQLDAINGTTSAVLSVAQAVTGLTSALLALAAHDGTTLPAFASGTASVPYDMTARIHQDEIIINRPDAQILRKYGVQTTGSADNKEMAQELRALRQENKMLSAAIVKNTEDMTAIVKRWERIGMPFSRIAA